MTDTIIQAGAVAGALTAIGALFVGSAFVVRKVVHIADAVTELVPNGGSSIKDQINRIEVWMAAHDEQHQREGVAADG